MERRANTASGGARRSGQSPPATPAWRRYALIAGHRGAGARGRRLDGIHFAHGGSTASRVGTDTDPNRIAVLYFDDESKTASSVLSRTGLTDALIDQLSAVKQLKVISRNGVAPFKGKNVSTDSIQRVLKVGTLVPARSRNSGDRLRVKVRLVDAATGTEVDSKTIDRGAPILFQLQDELAQQVSLCSGNRLATHREHERTSGNLERSRMGSVSAEPSRIWPASTRS